ncbi:DUF125-domain-containing protein [Podospora fimiseda]|uniref:DUF125-domain-containing protein n=1 Tax=Podospora fimiseda TaxID=252190 RepID=A0AAN7H612_9PEZI|nr:DUF125-domain-containing protein [Podospora fimiseda]
MSITLLKTLFKLSTHKHPPSSPPLQKTFSPFSPSDPDDAFSSSSSTDPESQHHPSSPPPSKPLLNPRLISDATIGLSDGLTVPFALTAGLSALGDTRTVIFGGLAELIAGAISMGLGGYLGAKSEADSHKTLHNQLTLHLSQSPSCIIPLLKTTLKPLNLPKPTLDLILSHQTHTSSASISPDLIDFLLLSSETSSYHHPPTSKRPIISGITISLGYFLGGLIPLIPYFCVKELIKGLYLSIGVMVIALFVFGYVKTGVVEGGETKWKKTTNCVKGGIQMVLVGGMAAGAAMGLVKGLSGAGVVGEK